MPRNPISEPVQLEQPVRHVVLDEIAARCRPDERDLAATFAQIFLDKAPPELLATRSVPELAAQILGDFRFLNRTRHSRAQVEVGLPSELEEGWDAPVTLIRTKVTERPFIVDTVREYLHDADLALETFVYPVMRVVRNQDGEIASIGPVAGGPPLESMVHAEVAEVSDPERRRRIQGELTHHLEDVVRATDDFGAMVGATTEAIFYLEECERRVPSRASEVREAAEFLRWLREGNFVFLGYRGYDIQQHDGERMLVAQPGSGLGVLRDERSSSYAAPVALSQLPAKLRARVEGGPLLIVSKTNARSTVHRRVRMDYIGVKKLDDTGHAVGERRFLGLFTSHAYAQDADRIPILREKLRAIVAQSSALPGSHDYKEIITIFNSMPKEDLFLASASEIAREVQTALRLYHTHEVRVTMRPDPLERGVSVMVVMPKERFSGDIRKGIEDALSRLLAGDVLNYHLAMGGGDQARLHFYVAAPPERTAAVDVAEVEEEVRELIRSWTDRIREALEQDLPGDEARRLAQRYGAAFPPEYRAAMDEESARRDILELERMAAEDGSIGIALTNDESAPGITVAEPVSILKVYLRGESLILSDFMPILEHAGLRIIAMSPFEVEGPGVPRATIYVFGVQDSARQRLDLESRGDQLSETILAVRAGETSSDPLNGLVLSAGLTWRQIEVLRTYAEYAFQLGAVPSRASLPNALRAHAAAAVLLLELFGIRLDPDTGLALEERQRRAEAVQRGFIRSLEGVSSLSDDRALRRLLALVQATVRTNYFRHGGATPSARSGGVPYISLKFSAEALQGIVRTRLLFEVWVQSPRMAGVHLRGGRVARGGIRHSDRPDDFRTEVLGLVKTQAVKNAVIVPAGSKGGFIVKRHHPDPAAMAAEVTDQYRTLMRGLLDITDNLMYGEVRHPPGVVAWDGTDPYLVVAADKGTAHLSDVANGVAAEYDFWLGDAFASGGSHGYDHKEVGITARGAWECVRRHFLEMGRDVQTQPVTVIGIGDMGGDVFGNGMLLSRQIRLVAAFDHRHIFVDPDPDPERSFQERERLFALKRGSWADYDRALLSEGGFIVPRAAKEVELPPRARAALGLSGEVTHLDGESLIRAVLAAPGDLLWNGGIGTYVKASWQTHGDVGDSTNDPVRIDAPDLRVKVIGEGGNLGLTQDARIEFALRGGRLNTDAIDNAGGVMMSDNEVNLKILLNVPVQNGRLAIEERNALLERLTPAVTDHVLADTAGQALAVSLDEARATDGPDDFADFMLRLERERSLDRALESLPNAEELAQRRAEGRTLTRPELAVLLAYSKLSLKQVLLASALPADPANLPYLVGYFPREALEAAGAGALEQHRLRLEIAATELTNDLVNLMGAAYINRTARDTGHSAAEVARAWVITSRLCGGQELRESLRLLEGEVPTRVIYRWLLGLARVLDRTARWVLANVPADVPATDFVAQHLGGLAMLRGHFGDVVAGQERAIFEARVAEIHELTQKEAIAERLITLRFLDQLLEILRVSHETGSEPLRAARAYYATSDLLGVGWIREALAAAGEDRWDQRAAQGFADDLGRAHRLLTTQVLAAAGDGEPESGLEQLRNTEGQDIAAYQGLVAEIRVADRPRLSALAVLARAALALAEPAWPLPGGSTTR